LEGSTTLIIGQVALKTIYVLWKNKKLWTGSRTIWRGNLVIVCIQVAKNENERGNDSHIGPPTWSWSPWQRHQPFVQTIQLICCYLIQLWVVKHRCRINSWKGEVAEVGYNNGKSVSQKWYLVIMHKHMGKRFRIFYVLRNICYIFG